MLFCVLRFLWSMAKKAPIIHTTLQQTKLILLAKAAEQSQDKSLGWTAADSEAAGLKAAHALGEGAAPEKMLAERAKCVLSILAERGVSTSINTTARLPQIFSPVLILIAFVLGILTDRIGSPEHIVNLLSPPFWSVLLWNLGVYVVLFLCAVGLIGSPRRFGLPFRNLLASLVEKTTFSTLKKGFKSEFLLAWARQVAPLVHSHVARTLHWAAVFFALGLIVSLLVRGFGTSYWAGWESTWLAEKPEAVKAFLDATYGAIPTWGALPGIPDVAQIAQLRSDRLAYLTEPVSASPWLIRMMIMIAAVVIVPRLLLIAINTWRMKRFTERTPLDISDAYYGNVLAQCAQDAALGHLTVIASAPDRPARAATVSGVRRLWGLDDESDVALLDFDDEEAPLPCVPPSERRGVRLLWLDGTDTPETSVHGTVLDRLNSHDQGNGVFAVFLDMTVFAERYKQLPERIKERSELWKAFIELHRVPLFVAADPDSVLSAVKSLRAWASGQSAVMHTDVAPEASPSVPNS